MIGEAASSVVEIAMAIAEGLKQVEQAVSHPGCTPLKLIDPGIERNRIFGP